jgi:hypothetical protein
MPLSQMVTAAGKGFNVPSVAKDMENSLSYIHKNETSVKSIFARKENDRYLKTVDEALGDVRIKVIYYDQDNNPITKPFYCADAHDYVVPDKTTGAFYLTNGDIVDEKERQEDIIEERVDELMAKCVKSDALCQVVLNIAQTEYDRLLAPNGGTADMSAEMKKLDGRVTYIKALPAGSPLQIQALSKLRVLVAARLHEYKPVRSGKSKADAEKARHAVPADAVAGRDLIAKQ